MNPTTISNKEDAAESRNQGERKQEIASVNATQSSAPVCKNGVCMVSWKPAKPQAA